MVACVVRGSNPVTIEKPICVAATPRSYTGEFESQIPLVGTSSPSRQMSEIVRLRKFKGVFLAVTTVVLALSLWTLLRSSPSTGQGSSQAPLKAESGVADCVAFFQADDVVIQSLSEPFLLDAPYVLVYVTYSAEATLVRVRLVRTPTQRNTQLSPERLERLKPAVAQWIVSQGAPKAILDSEVRIESIE